MPAALFQKPHANFRSQTAPGSSQSILLLFPHTQSHTRLPVLPSAKVRQKQNRFLHRHHKGLSRLPPRALQAQLHAPPVLSLEPLPGQTSHPKVRDHVPLHAPANKIP